MSLASFSVRKKVTVTMFTLIILLMGVISFSKLGLDLMPDIDYPTISVVTTYTGASPEDIEEMITKPMEGWVGTVSNVKKVQSFSKEGISLINIEFEWGTNLDFAAQDVRETISQYERYLPEEAEKPTVIKFNLSQIPVLMYGVSGKRSLFDVKNITEDKIAERLERLDGVAQVMVVSSEVREIQVRLDGDRVKSLSLSPDAVLASLSAENLNQPAGYFTQGHQEYILRTTGEFKDLETIRRISVGTTPEGRIVRLGEIATVVDGLKESRTNAKMSGEKAVFFIVSKSSGANIVKVADRVKGTLEKMKGDLPSDITLHLGMDMSEPVTNTAAGTTSDVIFGGLMVVVVIFLFLSNWRPTLTISISIPLSIIATFISFYVAGYTLNLITLVGLGLGVGMLVDNSVVVIENIFRRVEEEDEDVETASAKGTEEVGMAISASTFTTIGVFFPMLFTSGIVGKFAQALALSVSFALLSSLLVALTIVPMLTSVIFRGMGRESIAAKGSKERGFDRYRRLYKRLLEGALRKRKTVLTVVVLLFLLSFVAMAFLGTEFMPTSDNSTVLLKLKLPIGTPLAVTERSAGEIDKRLMARKEVLSIGTIVGVDENDQNGSSTETNPRGTHEAIFWIRLVPKSERALSGTDVIDEVKRSVPPYRGSTLETVDFSQSLTGGSSFPVDVRVYGKDLGMLKNISDRVSQVMASVSGFTDIHSSLITGKKEVHIEIDREKAYRFGLNVTSIASAVHTYTIGKTYTRYKEKGEEYDIRVLMDEKDRKRIEDIRLLPIPTPTGKRVYLKDVASLEVGTGPLEIERQNQVRKVSVLANVKGRDMGSTVEELKAKLALLEKNLPSGYFIEYAGQYEDMTSGFQDLFLAFLIAVTLVYMIMASQFEHLLHPLVIMFTVPMAFIGVIAALAAAGSPVNVIVFMGLIILAGVAVNNGIVMIDYINQKRKAGEDAYQAVVEGAVTRLRPILITSFTTVIGMVPMVFSKGEGAEMRQPIGLTIVGGLTAATLLTLFVIPIIYSYFNKIKPPPREEAR